ncbi:MAG: type II 3-dehydroquinate dehydratase [Kiritimatiellae bacterium]|nr:type II 3-dehydroquinate dehydratase [Kiritimatiellia bacterium]
MRSRGSKKANTKNCIEAKEVKILVLNGPNLNLLGKREPAIYGSRTYSDLEIFIKKTALEAGVEVEILQSNHEGVLIDRIQSAPGSFDALIVNAAAYTHTSVAMHDALKAIDLPVVEVHLTDPQTREEFRRFSYIKPVVAATFAGFGFESYAKAIRFLSESTKSV